MDNRPTSSSSSFQEQNQTEEESTTFYRPQFTPGIPSKYNIGTERYNSHGIPLKPSGKSAAVAAIQENREREKRELSQLNDRFASYIERVRFLEAQNKKLQVEIGHLRGKWGSETSKIKEKYDAEIHEARHIIDKTAKDRATAELRVKRAEEETLRLKEKYELLLAGRDSDRQKIELLQKQLFDNEADLNLFHRRLIDLEAEQKRSHNQSEKLILDLQRITKDLDQETITRIQLENQKQSLEEEMKFLKEIHSQEIEEIKQMNLMGTTLDPTNFFRNELANAVRNIREEYEQLNQQQRNELQSWYRLKVTEAIQEIQSRRAIEKSANSREQEEIKKLRTLFSDSQQDIATMRQRNGELENRIRELEDLIQIERKNNIRASDERDGNIKDLRIRLEDLGRNYDELISTKSTLDSEISIYRKLLDGEEKREGLQQILRNIPTNSSIADESTTYSRSYQKPGNSQGFGSNDFMFTSYVPYQTLSSAGSESTVFEQVYGGGRRRRPTSISLNIQRAPVVDRLSNYRWNPSDINRRKLKTKTFFDTVAMREQQQPKAVTPPSSDYTDAYLSAFAPKPFPTRRIYRVAAPVFANVAPIRTLLSTNDAIKTSQTRFNNMNDIQTSNSLDQILPPFPRSSSTYSSSFIPDISPKYEPLSNAPSSLPETRPYNSNDSTSLRNNQSSETTIHPSSAPSPSTIPITHRSETPHDNVYKPTPPDSLPSHLSSPAPSLSSSSTISAYKPFVPFPSAPLPSTSNTDQSSTNEQTVLPSSTTEKHMERPDTLVFQHDEDLRSPCIEKPSPLITPLLESPITRVESKLASTEELPVTSKPIEIFEKTLNKYDTIIDQISEILASVSPLSSTVSSTSPGKSVLDYELTSDGSPILQRKNIEPQSSQQSAATIRNTTMPRVKGKYLIRGDSYDKIVNAIADLDEELTPPPDIPKSTTTVIEEEKEESIASSSEDHQMSTSSEPINNETKTILSGELETSLILNEKKEEVEVLPTDEQQLSTGTEREGSEHQTSTISPSDDVLTSELLPLNETKLDVHTTTETPLSNTEFGQQQTDPLSNVFSIETIQEEARKSKDKLIFNKKNRKRVTWGAVVVSNEDDENSSSQSVTEESSLSETPVTSPEKERFILDRSTTVIEQQISTPISIENVVVDDQVNLTTFNELASSNEQKVTTADLIESPLITLQRPTKFSSSPETSSSISDSVDRQTTSSDLNESRSSHDEQVTSSESSVDTHFVPTLASSNKNTSTVGEQLTTSSNVVNKENTNLQVTKMESNEAETPIQLVDVTEDEAQTSTIKDMTVLSLPTIESPINTFADSVSPRYISSDVYHGYLGDHRQSIENPSDIDQENKKKSLVASLRQTIAASATPLIETIQTVVSSMRTLTALPSLKNENEVIDHSQNEATLAYPVATDSNEKNIERATQLEENESTIPAFEKPEMLFESLSDTVTKPVQTIASNLQGDKQEVVSTSSTELVSETLSSTEEMKDLTTLEPVSTSVNTSPSVEKLDDHSPNDIELTPSALSDSVQKKAPDAIITSMETVDVPSMQTLIMEEPMPALSPTDTLHDETIENLMNASATLTSQIIKATSSNEDKEQILPSTNTTMIESPSSEILILSPADDETTKSNIAPNDEEMSTKSVIPSEYIDTTNTQERIDNNFVDQKSEELKLSEDKTSEIPTPTPIVEDGEKVSVPGAVSSEGIDETQADFEPEPVDVTASEHKEIDTSFNETTRPLTIMLERIDSVVSSSPTDENLLLVEQDFARMNDQTNDEYITSTETIRASTSPSEEKEQVLTLEKSDPDNKIPDEEKISLTGALSLVSDDGVPQSTTPQQPSVAVPLVDDITTNEKTDTQITLTNSTMTEPISTSENDELASASNKETEIIQEIVPDVIDNLTQSIISEFQPNSKKTKQEISSSDSGLIRSIISPIDDVTQQTTTELQSDSVSIPPKTEQISSVNFRESSPTNTEPDSLELIHALHGHSIILPNLSEQLYHPPDKSLSSTTSSQITSSDRYVSFAIHQMGDSSQDRLPSFPLAADIPIYENPQENALILANPSIPKDDDSTELDATDNLTSYSDDILLQRLQASAINRQQIFDASSTDDDVDDEIEQHDLTDLERIIDKLSQPHSSLNTNEEPYQRYDLAATSSSNDSSSSPRQQADDIYFIPGYTGLWRPSADNNNANLPIDYDADDERKTTSKTRPTFRTLNSTKRPLSFEHHQNQSINVPHPPEIIDIFNRPLNEFSFDISESDSYQTCPSSISKQVENYSEFDQSQEQHQTSPDESIFLIRQHERGISLPITMKIDCDDMAVRLSTSSPVDTHLYSTIPPDLSSSTHSEPPLPLKTDSPSSSSHEQKFPSWLNTINTITTTTDGSDGPLESRITLLKSAKGPISISECHPQGNYIIIENTSRSKNIDLTNWKIQQENEDGDNLIYIFPDQCLLRPNQTLKILTQTNQSEKINDTLIASSISSWYTGPQILTTLINPEGKDCATFTKTTTLS